jgi:hypothetical protein
VSDGHTECVHTLSVCSTPACDNVVADGASYHARAAHTPHTSALSQISATVVRRLQFGLSNCTHWSVIGRLDNHTSLLCSENNEQIRRVIRAQILYDWDGLVVIEKMRVLNHVRVV